MALNNAHTSYQRVTCRPHTQGTHLPEHGLHVIPRLRGASEIEGVQVRDVIVVAFPHGGDGCGASVGLTLRAEQVR